jgi:hypothetical protein
MGDPNIGLLVASPLVAVSLGSHLELTTKSSLVIL